LPCSFSFALEPFLGENFLPSIDSGQILMHISAQPGTRIEETARLFDQVEQSVRQAYPHSTPYAVEPHQPLREEAA
jgi:multidrug efflux pump subunit AcrB